MYQIVGDERVQAHHPKLLLGGWKFNDGCPALTESGCMLSYDDRPALCRSYPFQPVPAIDGSTMLLLSVKTCPHWKEFGEHYQEIIKELGL